MVQGIANQILSETPSQTTAPVNATTQESSQPASQSTESKDPNDFDSRFSVLTKMERRIKEQESQFKNKEREWGEREKGWGDKEKKYQEMEEFYNLMDENPLEALKRRKGWGVQEFNEFAVKHSSDEDLDPVAKITKGYESKMAELEKKLVAEMEEKIKAKEQEISAKDNERQIVEFKSNIKSHLAENKDSYEFIHAEENGQDAVYELIYEDVLRQRQEGVADDQLRVMDIKEAAEKVESFLDKTYSKFLALNKVKSRLQPQSEEDRFSKFIKQSEPTTLNSSFSPKSKSVDQLSTEERKQAAKDLVRSWKT